MARSSFLDLSGEIEDSRAAAFVTRRGVSGAVWRPGSRGLLLFEIGGEADAAMFRRRRVHELADRGEDCGDRLVVGGELFLETRLQLIEFLSELSVRDQQLAHT